MPSNLDTFTFDINYPANNVGVFTRINFSAESELPPPEPGNFLLMTDSTPIRLTTLGFLILA